MSGNIRKFYDYDYDESEIEILKFLKALVERVNEKLLISSEEISKNLNLELIKVNRALYWLSNKGLINFYEKKEEKFLIDDKNLPELRLLDILVNKKKLDIKDAKTILGNAFNIAFGELKASNLIDFKDGNIYLRKEFLEKHVNELKNKLRVFKEINNFLENDDKNSFKYLNKRSLLKKEVKSKFYVELDDNKLNLIKNLDISKLKSKISLLDKNIIKNQLWKEKGIKRYNIQDPVPRIYGGRIHPLKEVIDKTKQIWLSMGFEEEKGPIIVPALLNFDTLVVPQDHLAREMQDTFYLNKELNLENFKDLLEKTKEIHEKIYGFFDENESKKLLIRTQNTAITAYNLFKLSEKIKKALIDKDNINIKLFSIDKVFRNETADKTHLTEFFQSEGIVISKGLTVENLKFFLDNFFKKMGFSKMKYKIAYFPFTEPSFEVFVYHEGLEKYIELGGAGIFRKEINQIFNIPKDYNILAWGLGIERIAMVGVKDIRELNSNKMSIEFLRNYKSYYYKTK